MPDGDDFERAFEDPDWCQLIVLAFFFGGLIVVESIVMLVRIIIT